MLSILSKSVVISSANFALVTFLSAILSDVIPPSFTLIVIALFPASVVIELLSPFIAISSPSFFSTLVPLSPVNPSFFSSNAVILPVTVSSVVLTFLST